MGKKSSQLVSMKISKHEKKQQLNSLIKILKPKVYITDSSNFKKLVQQLTGNGKYSPAETSSPPPPPTSVSLSPPTWEVIPFAETEYDHHHHHQIAFQDVDLSLNCELSENSMDKQKTYFYKDLESMLMEMDEVNCDYDACNYGMFQQDQVCFYDYDLSTLI